MRLSSNWRNLGTRILPSRWKDSRLSSNCWVIRLMVLLSHYLEGYQGFIDLFKYAVGEDIDAIWVVNLGHFY